MKTRFLFIILIGLFTILTGCNGDENQVADAQEQAQQADDALEEDDNDRDDMDVEKETVTNRPAESPFSFTHFDLDIDYNEDVDFEVEYEDERNEMEAEIKNDLANEHLKGDEAYSKLEPIFEQFKFDQNTPDDDVISEVLKAFDLDNNFHKFELEVKFNDGTEKEYIKN